MNDVALRRFPLAAGIVYGPIPTRRLGLSLGINLLPAGRKLCSFDCRYCQLGSRRPTAEADRAALPSPDDVRRAVRSELARLRRLGILPDTITFSGNGEPTLHPRFEAAVQAVQDAVDLEGARIPIAVLSNAAHLDRPSVVHALNSVRYPILKLDAGTQDMFERMNRPRRGLELARVVDGIRKVRSAIVQTMFVAGTIDNTTGPEIDAWIERIRETGARSVQIYTVARLPAEPGVRPVSRSRLVWIAGRLGAATGIVADLHLSQEA